MVLSMDKQLTSASSGSEQVPVQKGPKCKHLSSNTPLARQAPRECGEGFFCDRFCVTPFR